MHPANPLGTLDVLNVPLELSVIAGVIWLKAPTEFESVPELTVTGPLKVLKLLLSATVPGPVTTSELGPLRPALKVSVPPPPPSR